MNNISLVVSQNLHLDVTGLFNQLFQEQRTITEGVLCFTLASFKGFNYLI